MPTGIFIGIAIGGGGSIIPIAQSLINAFKARVTADSGMYEAESCQLAILTTFNNIA